MVGILIILIRGISNQQRDERHAKDEQNDRSIRIPSKSSKNKNTTPSIKMKFHYQLFIGSTEPAGRPFDAEGMIETALEHIQAFRKAIKNMNEMKLNHCDAVDLKVYKHRADSVKDSAALSYDDPVPEGTAKDSPLIVVAPAKDPQLAPNGELLLIDCLLTARSHCALFIVQSLLIAAVACSKSFVASHLALHIVHCIRTYGVANYVRFGLRYRRRQ